MLGVITTIRYLNAHTHRCTRKRARTDTCMHTHIHTIVQHTAPHRQQRRPCTNAQPVHTERQPAECGHDRIKRKRVPCSADAAHHAAVRLGQKACEQEHRADAEGVGHTSNLHMVAVVVVVTVEVVAVVAAVAAVVVVVCL